MLQCSMHSFYMHIGINFNINSIAVWEYESQCNYMLSLYVTQREENSSVQLQGLLFYSHVKDEEEPV